MSCNKIDKPLVVIDLVIRAHPAISHCSHWLLKMQSGYKYKLLAKSKVKVKKIT